MRRTGYLINQISNQNQVFAFCIPLLFFLEARHLPPSITQFATMFFFTPRNPYRVYVLRDDFFKLRTKFRLYSRISRSILFFPSSVVRNVETGKFWASASTSLFWRACIFIQSRSNIRSHIINTCDLFCCSASSLPCH